MLKYVGIGSRGNKDLLETIHLALGCRDSLEEIMIGIPI
jgi:hypothetical protein